MTRSDDLPQNNRILIVDDNPSIHDDFEKVLSAPVDTPEEDELQSLFDEVMGEESADGGIKANIHYDLSHAFQGQEAFEMVKQAHHDGKPFSLAFIDVRMPPGWDGIVTVSEMWSHFPDLEVVICTAYSDYDWTQILDRLGTSDRLQFVRKPIDIVSIQQMALALTTKWNLGAENRAHVANLESRVEERTTELKEKVEALEQALKEIEQLQGIIPMCSYCHKVRDDKDFWHRVDSYIQRHSKAEVSHGVCPDCYETVVMPQIDKVSRPESS